MSQLSKQDLKAENQLQFPNNNVGAITPSNLKAFNVDMIDSTVNQTTFDGFSGSVSAEIIALQNLSSSLSGGFVTQGELAAATGALESQIGTKLNISETSSMTVLSSSYAITASFALNAGTTIDTGSLVGTASFNAYTSSTNSRLNNIETTTASLNNSVSLINTFTSSANNRLNAIEAVSGSWITESETGSFARTDASNTFTPAQSFLGNVTIAGNLYVSGSEVIVSSSTLIVGDRIIEVNANKVIGDAGIYAFDAIGNQTGSMIWDPNVDYWKAGLSGSETRVITAADTASMLQPYLLSSLTGSFATTGSNVFTGDQTLVDGGGNTVTLSDVSGSLMLVAKGFTSASAHLSSSYGTSGAVNIIFKNNNNTADTWVSGSNNIFTNQTAAAAGFKRVINGDGNIFLGTSAVPSVTGSALFETVRTTSNLVLGTTSFRVGSNMPYATAGHNINSNIINGALNFGSAAAPAQFYSSSIVSSNIINGTLNLLANTNQLQNAASQISANNIIGFASINMRNSPIGNFLSNIVTDNAFTVTIDYFSGSIGVGTVLPQVNRNIFAGSTNALLITGSAPGPVGTIAPNLINSMMLGANNTIRMDGSQANTRVQGSSIALLGYALNVTGSSLNTETATLGTVIVGRWNASDGIRDTSTRNVFVVGTGTAAGTRKTGFLIDSGSNTFIEGTLNVSGATSLNGNLIVTGSLTASLGQGLMYVGNASGLTSTISTASLAVENALTSSITRNVIVIARNGGSSTLPAGTVVHITSALGDNPVFTTASYDTEALSGNTFGLLRYSSAPGADVEVVVSGVVTGVDTDPAKGYTAGDIVYLSSSGQFTRVQPQAPNQIVTLGQVLRAQQNNGSIYVSINNGWELDELHNVQITSPQTDNLLVYESASYGLWKNKTLTAIGGLTTASFNTATGSFITTGSVTGNVLTFTKGDASTFSLTVATGSGGGGVSFPYTGSAEITGSLGVTGSVNGFVNTLTISSNTASLDFTRGNFFTLQLVSGSITHLTATNIIAGQTINLLVRTASGSAAASGSLTFSPTFKFAGGIDYTPTAITASQDLVSFVTFDTTQVFASQIKNLS